MQRIRPWAISIGGGIAAAWLLSFAWWLVLEPATASDDVYELVIPRGTAEAVAAGEQAPFIPNSLSLGRNRKMVIRNEDVVGHAVGAWTVPPGGTAEIVAEAGTDELTCTIHPAGVLGMSVDERPAFVSTFAGALALGIPIGVVFGFAKYVGRRLSVEADGPGA